MRLPFVCSLVLLAGCADEVETKVFVNFDASERVKAWATLARVEVRYMGEVRFDKTFPIVEPGEEDENSVAFPFSVPLVPRGGDASRVYTVFGQLLNPDGFVDEQRVRSTYIEGEEGRIDIFFDQSCGVFCEEQTGTCGRFCDDDERCVRDRCEDYEVLPVPR